MSNKNGSVGLSGAHSSSAWLILIWLSHFKLSQAELSQAITALGSGLYRYIYRQDYVHAYGMVHSHFMLTHHTFSIGLHLVGGCAPKPLLLIIYIFFFVLYSTFASLLPNFNYL